MDYSCPHYPIPAMAARMNPVTAARPETIVMAEPAAAFQAEVFRPYPCLEAAAAIAVPVVLGALGALEAAVFVIVAAALLALRRGFADALLNPCPMAAAG